MKKVKNELERIFGKGFIYNEGKCSNFEYAEVLIDCDTKQAVLAIHNGEEMSYNTLIGLIDFNYMLKIDNHKIGLKITRFYEDDNIYAWLDVKEVIFGNNVMCIICEVYIATK